MSFSGAMSSSASSFELKKMGKKLSLANILSFEGYSLNCHLAMV